MQKTIDNFVGIFIGSHIASAFAGNQNFFARTIIFFKQHHLRPILRSSQRRHHTAGAGTNYNHTICPPVLEDIFDLETFKAAYKAKAANQALFTGIITSEKDAPAAPVSSIETIKKLANPTTAEEAKAIIEAGQVRDVNMGNGNIIQLNPGEKWQTAESDAPAADFAQFVASELAHICAGVGDGGIAAEMVLQKYNNNYSASRATIAGQEKKFRNLRSLFAFEFCDPIWEQVIDWAIRKGYVEAPGYLEGDWMFRKSVLACTWIENSHR